MGTLPLFGTQGIARLGTVHFAYSLVYLLHLILFLGNNCLVDLK
jgi:hypothetical protein